MNVTYSPTADAVAIELVPDAKSVRTVTFGPDTRADFDERGRLITIELLNAGTYYSREELERLQRPVDYLTLTEAAKESGLAPATLRLQLNRGRIQGVKRGRDWVIARHVLWNYLENREPGGRPATSAKAKRIRRRATKKKLARA
jgi:uncharacterized protein YuzE